MSIFKLLLSAISALFIISCNSPSPANHTKKFDTYISEKFEKDLKSKSNITIAVMPVPNRNSSTVADYFRKNIIGRLEQKGYSLIDPKVLDQALYNFGQKTPSKLKDISAENLRALTSADFLLYGAVETSSQDGRIYYSGSLLLHDLNKQDMWYALSNLNIEKKEGIDPLSTVVEYLVSAKTTPIGILFDVISSEKEIYEGLEFYVDTLLSSLPDGQQSVNLVDEGGRLLDKATTIKAD
ncbi:hypothetical protein GSY74_07680 [Sulfurovum sp. bin170]|uniref:hypothetical protein n=1 Tax=Sulfurovum sp. bin170 TaxID=2695268 RepID=UPI0013E0930E|nr:hypothetical protein [Sulfurovum sp. bin170]NEW61159.1 hypothetical protein [Sulfurovum sp. bin170]